MNGSRGSMAIPERKTAFAMTSAIQDNPNWFGHSDPRSMVTTL